MNMRSHRVRGCLRQDVGSALFSSATLTVPPRLPKPTAIQGYPPRCRSRRRWLTTLLLAMLAQLSPGQAVWHVDADAPPGGDGRSWSTAFAHLQPALQNPMLAAGDEIWVAEGVYTPDLGTGDRDASFLLVDGVAIYGGFFGNEITLDDRRWEDHPTILSGDLAADDGPNWENTGENSRHVLRAFNLMDEVILDGFIIRGGNADDYGESWWGGGLWAEECVMTIRNCTFSRCQADGDGGAVLAYGRVFTFENCVFADCRAEAGGAVLIFADDRHLVFRDSEFVNNQIEGGVGEGGALFMYVGDDGAIVERCRFESNSTAGASAMAGGAVSIGDDAHASAQILFSHCLFRNNGRDGRVVWGGAIYSNARMDLEHCEFIGNEAEIGGAFSAFAIVDSAFAGCTFFDNVAEHGGAMWFLAENLRISECRFVGNRAYGSAGGAIGGSLTNSHIEGSMFADNATTDRGGAIYGTWVNTLVTGSTFVNNFADLSGGAIDMANDGSGHFDDCRFLGNMTFGEGGAIFVQRSAAFVDDSLFTGNSAMDGGAIYSSRHIDLSNCTMVGNFAQPHLGLGGGAFCTPLSVARIGNCIIWDNRDRNGVTEASQVHANADDAWITYSLVQHLDRMSTGPGNINLDPRLVDADGPDNLFGTLDDDLRLAPGSPGIDAGDNAWVTSGNLFDAHGGARFVDDRSTPDTGAGEAPIVDIGGLEFGSEDYVLRLRGPTPARAGEFNTVAVTNATPFARLTLVQAPKHGQTPIPNCPNFHIDLTDPVIAAVTFADANGQAEIRQFVPPGAHRRAVRLQMIDHLNCAKSNAVVVTFK